MSAYIDGDFNIEKRSIFKLYLEKLGITNFTEDFDETNLSLIVAKKSRMGIFHSKKCLKITPIALKSIVDKKISIQIFPIEVELYNLFLYTKKIYIGDIKDEKRTKKITMRCAGTVSNHLDDIIDFIITNTYIPCKCLAPQVKPNWLELLVTSSNYLDYKNFQIQKESLDSLKRNSKSKTNQTNWKIKQPTVNATLQIISSKSEKELRKQKKIPKEDPRQPSITNYSISTDKSHYDDSFDFLSSSSQESKSSQPQTRQTEEQMKKRKELVITSKNSKNSQSLTLSQSAQRNSSLLQQDHSPRTSTSRIIQSLSQSPKSHQNDSKTIDNFFNISLLPMKQNKLSQNSKTKRPLTPKLAKKMNQTDNTIKNINNFFPAKTGDSPMGSQNNSEILYSPIPNNPDFIRELCQEIIVDEVPFSQSMNTEPPNIYELNQFSQRESIMFQDFVEYPHGNESGQNDE